MDADRETGAEAARGAGDPRSIELRVHTTMRTIDEAAWDALVGPDGPPYLAWAWLDALERTGCVAPEKGWAPHHLTLSRGGALVAAAPGYVKGHSEGEFVFDHQWAHLAQRLGVDYYPKLLFAVPFTPATGPRLLCADADRASLLPVLAEAMRRLCDTHGITTAHLLFPTEPDARALAAAGLAHRYGIQFHWQNKGYSTFDDFLAGFQAKRRHQIRRERRALDEQGLTLETLTGRDLTPEVVDAMFGFYLSTVEKFSWGRQYLSRGFFEDVCSRLGDKVEIVLARDGKRPIAGAFNLAGGGVLYGRYWGASEERPFLHFNVCYYHSIAACIERGFERFEPGAGGEHKVVRGFDPTITHSLHHLAHPRLDRIVRDHLERERHHIAASIATPEERG